MPNQPSKTEDRPGIQGDSKKRVLRLHSEGLRQYSPGQLILPKQRPHLADRAAIFQRGLEAAEASGGFSDGGEEIWAAEHTTGPGSIMQSYR